MIPALLSIIAYITFSVDALCNTLNCVEVNLKRISLKFSCAKAKA